MRTRIALLLGAVGLPLAACATDGAYGGGLQYGYGYDSPYGYNCYGPYGYGAYGGYGIDDCGWYDGFFYPGYGTFVYDRNHHRHEMTMRQHDYFTRQGHGAEGERSVGMGSSDGAVQSVSQPMSGSGVASVPGQRTTGGRVGGSFGGRGSGFGGGFHGGAFHGGGGSHGGGGGGHHG